VLSGEELRLWGILGTVITGLLGVLGYGVRMLLQGRLIPVREHQRVIQVYETRNEELANRNKEWQDLYFQQVRLNSTLNEQLTTVLDSIRKAREAGAA
jgi:hypothetical protein